METAAKPGDISVGGICIVLETLYYIRLGNCVCSGFVACQCHC